MSAEYRAPAHVTRAVSVHPGEQRLTRRRALRLLTLPALAGPILAACGAPATPTAAPTPATAAKATSAPAPTAVARPAEATKPAAAAATTAPSATTPAPAAAATPAPTAAAKPAAKTGGILRHGTTQTGVIPTWLPWKALSSAQATHWGYSMSRLVMQDNQLKIRPDLAEKWEISADGLTYTFSLRKGVKWHDGKPFTAKDVAFTYQAATLPKAGSTLAAALPFKGVKEFQEGQANKVEGIQVVDDHTIRFVLDKPNNPIMSQAFASLFITPAHPFEGIANPEDWAKTSFATDKPIGTGPFKFTEYKPDQHSIFEANPDYFLGRPRLDQVLFKFYADANVMMLDMEKGQLDVVGASIPTQDELKKWQSNQSVVIDEYETGLASPFLSLSFKREFFRDKRVRQAALYAIDRKRIAEQVYGGLRKPALVSPWAAPQYNPPNLNAYDYNPERAKQLLKEANWDSSREINLTWFGDKMPDDLPIIHQQLGAVGFNIKLVQVERARIMNIFYETRDYEMSYLGGYGGKEPWGQVTTLPCTTIYPKGWNSMEYCNQQVDELFDVAVSSTDEKKRTDALLKIAQVFNEELPYLPLFFPISYNIWSKKVKGWESNKGMPVNSSGYFNAWEWSLEG